MRHLSDCKRRIDLYTSGNAFNVAECNEERTEGEAGAGDGCLYSLAAGL